MENLLLHCTGALIPDGTALPAFFMAGIAGSLTHCLAMCAPVSACQSACSSSCGARGFDWRYHAGRAASYGIMGFFASLLSAQIAAFSFWPYLSSAMLAVAGLMFIAASIKPGKHAPFSRSMLLGFMPCGLLYAALMMAATLVNPFMGLLSMLAFALGTLPILALAGFSAARLARKWQFAARNIGRAAMAGNGAFLLVMSINLIR